MLSFLSTSSLLEPTLTPAEVMPLLDRLGQIVIHYGEERVEIRALNEMVQPADLRGLLLPIALGESAVPVLVHPEHAEPQCLPFRIIHDGAQGAFLEIG